MGAKFYVEDNLKKELFYTSDDDDAHLSTAAENGPCRDG